MNRSYENSEEHDELQNAIAKEVGLCTPQLFYHMIDKPNLPLYAHGSSVIVMVSDCYFLITAAHVFHQEKLDQIGVALGSDFCNLGGLMKYFQPNGSDYFDPNNTDIAISKLDKEMVQVIKEKYKFLPFDKFNVSTNRHYSRYVVFGYPAESTVKNFPTKQIRPSPFILRTVSADPKYYDLHGIDKNKVIVVRCNLNQVINSSTQSATTNKELDGISGAGLWHVHDNAKADNPIYHLAGIITGGTTEVLYATRIEVIWNLLRNEFGIHFVY